MTVINLLSRRREPVAHAGFEAAAVANAIIDLATNAAEPMTHLRLQKLLYICQAWHLMRHGRPLIAERPRVWPLGSVFESAYVVICQLSGNRLVPGEMIASRFDQSIPRLPVRHADVAVREAVEEALITVKTVWRGMFDRTDEQLSSMLHLPAGGWYRALTQCMDSVPDEFMVEEAKTWSRPARDRQG